MAPEDDAYKRRREREKEQDQEEEQLRQAKQDAKMGRTGNSNPYLPQKSSEITASRAEELLERAEPLMERITSLYQQYVAGFERLPPIELRKQLDAIIQAATSAHKATQASQFRFNTIFARYQAYKDKWERTMRDIESGKIKRVLRPGAK